MSAGIFKTNVAKSSPMVVPLSNPKEKFGDTFKVNHPYASNGIDSSVMVQYEEDEPHNKFFTQDFDGLSINLKWGVYSPRFKNVIRGSDEINNNP